MSFTTTISPVINTTNDLKSAEFIPAESNFSAIFITTGCRTWNDENNTWKMEGCEVRNLVKSYTYLFTEAFLLQGFDIEINLSYVVL